MTKDTAILTFPIIEATVHKYLSRSKSILLMCALFLAPYLDAQITLRDDKKLFFEADKALEFGDYLTAYNTYIQLLKVDNFNPEVNFKLGICSFNITKLRSLSMSYFEKSSKSTYPEIHYYLGRLNHLAREYATAISNYNNYKNSVGNKEFSTKYIDDLIAKSNTARLFETVPEPDIQILNLGDNINTIYDEYVPLIPASEDFIIFTSRRPNNVWKNKNLADEYFEDIYIAKADSVGGWQSPTLLDDSVVNTATHDASTGLSADGDFLLIYRTNTTSNTGDIYETFNEEGTWTTPQKLNSNVNSAEFVETSACYSTDRTMVFFSSDRPGGFGGKDLYRSIKLPSGNWGEPFNLGKEINTEYDEDAPYVHPVGEKIYFSSQGHQNMGGYDIFESTFDEYGNFTTPINLGYPLNTVGDDIFFVLNSNSTVGYLSSDRAGGEGGQDLYSIKFSIEEEPVDVFSLFFIDEKSNLLITNVTMEAIDLKRKVVYGKYKASDKTGKMLFISEPQKEYKIIVTADGYEPFITNTVFLSHSPKKIFTLTKSAL
jgi:WD40-like Beta Propeller Repeat